MISNSNDPKVKEHAQKVIAWRDFLSTMNDTNFFSLIHMYLGEVKTPYHKQNLIEQLNSFLRKEEHQKTILSLLDEKDILVLNAIHFIPNPTQQKLISFFKDTFSFVQLYEILSNFEERLLIFQNNRIYFTNPLLDKSLEKVFNISFLLSTEKPEEFEPVNSSGLFTLSESFFAAMYALISSYPDLCKIDGSFKKKMSVQLGSIFPSVQDERVLSLFIAACKNLSLFTADENDIFVNKKRWIQFSRLDFASQLVYLVVASSGRYSLSQLSGISSSFFAMVKSIHEEGMTKKILLRLADLVESKNAENVSRLSKIVASQNYSETGSFESSVPSDDAAILPSLVENSITFNVFTNTAFTENGEKVYSLNDSFKQWFQNGRQENREFNAKPLSIDASFSAFIMEGSSLENMIELTDAMEFVRFDSIFQLELTKKSVISYFERNEGKTADDLISFLQESSLYEIPQNVVFSIKEWYEQFKSARIYHGFVLHVLPNKRTMVEKNAEISGHIKKTLAEGVYLLDYANNEELETSIEQSKLDFLSFQKTEARESLNTPFKPVEENPEMIFEIDSKPLEQYTDFARHYSLLCEELEKLTTSKEQYCGLQDRINRKIIIDKNQLRPESVKIEKLEAFGMDYNGKLHVIENAISTNSFLELTYDDAESADGLKIFVARPASIERTNVDTFLTVFVEPEGIKKVVSVGSARIVRRLLGKNRK